MRGTRENDSRKIVIAPSAFIPAFVTVCLTGLGRIPPNPWGGFYCDDAHIKVHRSSDTMPTSVLLVLVFIPALLVVSKPDGSSGAVMVELWVVWSLV